MCICIIPLDDEQINYIIEFPMKGDLHISHPELMRKDIANPMIFGIPSRKPV